MRKLILSLAFCFVSTLGFCNPIPINHFTEIEHLDSNTRRATIMAYPKYYTNDVGVLEEADVSLVASSDDGWDWEVKKGVYKLRVKNDGTFEFNHMGDIVQLQLKALGFYNTDTKELNTWLTY